MQSIFFVNAEGNLIIPSQDVLARALSKIKHLPALFPKNWPIELIEGSCDMPVLEGMSGEVSAPDNSSRVVVCRSHNLWKKFLRAESLAVNGVALKCWNRGYLNSKPKSSIVFITDGVIDPSGEGYELSSMDMKTNPIAFVEIGAMQ